MTEQRNQLMYSPQLGRDAEVVEEASDRAIDDMVQDLNELLRSSGMDLALRIGKMIIERFYGGDTSRWRLHRSKDVSFRKLAKRADRDLRISAAGLYRAVALYDMTERLNIKRSSHLGPTHLRSVLGLPENTQLSLLKEAEDMRWTTVRLEAEAAKHRSIKGRKGRCPNDPMLKFVRNLAKTWNALQRHISADEIGTLMPDERSALYRSIDEIKVNMEMFLRRIPKQNGETPARYAR